MAGKTAIGEVALEFTPTWVVAVVCSIIVLISLILERSLHYLGQKLKKRKPNALYQALMKVKEELMLLGFISLLLVVFQGRIHRICVPPGYMNHMQPCKKVAATAHYGSTAFEGVLGGYRRRLFAMDKSASNVCVSKGQVPVLSLDAIHKLHIFIFVLAISHVLFSVTTMLLGLLKMKEWIKWERTSASENGDSLEIIDVHEDKFIKKYYHGFNKEGSPKTWLCCFGKQFYGSITEMDYKALRRGFIKKNSPGDPNLNFHEFMIRTLEVDFKTVVGLRWYLWIFVIIFLLVNVDGWHLYFWVSFIPLILLLAVGTKLEHVIVKMAHAVAEKNTHKEGPIVIEPNDEYFWFCRPHLVLHVIHFIVFQNAFDTAFFFWILTSFGLKSCIMGPAIFVISRLVVGVIIQILCGYMTLPLYAITMQMSSSRSKDIFAENIRESLRGWAQTARNRRITQATPTQPRRVTEGSPDVLTRNMAGTGEINLEEGPDRSSV